MMPLYFIAAMLGVSFYVPSQQELSFKDLLFDLSVLFLSVQRVIIFFRFVLVIAFSFLCRFLEIFLCLHVLLKQLKYGSFSRNIIEIIKGAQLLVLPICNLQLPEPVRYVTFHG